MFSKKKTPEQKMKAQDRELRRTNRGLDRDRGQLEKEEKKIEMEIRKAAKQGNKQACAVLAKQLLQLRRQKTRMYAASSQITSVGIQAKTMNANMKMAKAMGTTTKTMTAMNKQMDPQKMAKTMQEFERENMKMGMSEELINDTLDEAMGESGDEEEQDSIISQVLDEIGIDMSSKLGNAAGPSRENPKSSNVAEEEIERQLRALGVPDY